MSLRRCVCFVKHAGEYRWVSVQCHFLTTIQSSAAKAALLAYKLTSLSGIKMQLGGNTILQNKSTLVSSQAAASLPLEGQITYPALEIIKMLTISISTRRFYSLMSSLRAKHGVLLIFFRVIELYPNVLYGDIPFGINYVATGSL